MDVEANKHNSLSVEEVRELWSKTYNKQGKPDWSHIFHLYNENIIFQDSIQKIEGKDEFLKMINRLTKRCKSLHMELYNITKTDNIVMMDWKMTMSFRVFPESPMFGATKLTFNDEGSIIEQRDYYDLWGDIYDRVPGFGIFYRWFMRSFFG